MHVTRSGSLVAKSKANKFHVTIFGPESDKIVEQEIISDGKTQWTYLKKNNEVQVNNAQNDEEGLNPAKIFTIYEHGYKYIYNGEKKIDGKVYQEIDLTPENIDKEFFKVRLTIDKEKKQIHSALIFDKNGNHYTYTVRNFTGNPALPENMFTFDQKEHKGVEVVGFEMKGRGLWLEIRGQPDIQLFERPTTLLAVSNRKPLKPSTPCVSANLRSF